MDKSMRIVAWLKKRYSGIGCSIRLSKGLLAPGPGWEQMGGPVWDHSSGVRVHWSGRLIRDSFGQDIVLTRHEERVLDDFIEVNGGNEKRGIMAFAKHR